MKALIIGRIDVSENFFVYRTGFVYFPNIRKKGYERVRGCNDDAIFDHINYQAAAIIGGFSLLELYDNENKYDCDECNSVCAVQLRYKHFIAVYGFLYRERKTSEVFKNENVKL